MWIGLIATNVPAFACLAAFAALGVAPPRRASYLSSHLDVGEKRCMRNKRKKVDVPCDTRSDSDLTSVTLVSRNPQKLFSVRCLGDVYLDDDCRAEEVYVASDPRMPSECIGRYRSLLSRLECSTGMYLSECDTTTLTSECKMPLLKLSLLSVETERVLCNATKVISQQRGHGVVLYLT